MEQNIHVIAWPLYRAIAETGALSKRKSLRDAPAGDDLKDHPRRMKAPNGSYAQPPLTDRTPVGNPEDLQN